MKPTMMTYIHEEHATLSQILNNYPASIPAIEDENEWLLLATGSSVNAAVSAKYYIESLSDVRVTIAEPFHYQHFEKHNPAIRTVVAVSQSGESTSTLHALAALKKRFTVKTVGVTSKPQSELAKTADTFVLLDIGEERVGYVTKGYVSTILTLMLMGLRHAHAVGAIDDARELQELATLREAVNAIPAIIDTTESFFSRWKDCLIASPRFTSIGYGPAVGVCMEMATKFTETVRVPSQGIEMEVFMHGPYFEINPQHRLFFLDVPSVARERLNLLRQYEQRHTQYVYTVTPGSSDDPHTLALNVDVPETVLPLLMIIPFQILAHHIAEGKGNNLPQRIFTDFGIAVKSKTKPGDYA
ncbi:SIS domain-containing protein [Scandinavium manionii]|uniref:SIS domain-containing protein n=1 Tax=Scandinavium manionii TaxID=2926520 RepID=UPI002164F9C7|nr:SIS domain-containing protein [Scandinavium manionii]MCS2149139.1 SIS domain-containing protein [Scandinavium manionii]MCS2165421.1 SIS domain-containing protein [Scandinavium manionii]